MVTIFPTALRHSRRARRRRDRSNFEVGDNVIARVQLESATHTFCLVQLEVDGVSPALNTPGHEVGDRCRFPGAHKGQLQTGVDRRFKIDTQNRGPALR